MRKLFRPYLTFLLLGSLLVSASSCGDDDNPTPPETEEIASARLVLEPEGKGQLVTINYSETAQSPSAVLKASTTYTGTLTLFNPSGTDITAEISQEADMHEVFYEPSSGLGLTVQKTDTDSKGRPLGLKATMTTTNASSGTMRVRLKHQSNKGTSDVSKGETDLDMTVNVTIQ
jgi:hypothetical protein